MKNENGNIRTEQGNIKRWEQYFSKILNEENERLIRGDGDANQGAVLKISRIEVQQALKMKNGKVTGPDGIPIEAWKAMGEEGIDMLWMLMGKVMGEENMPTVWKESILIPIFKEKGDVQNCENYRGMTDGVEVKVGLHQGSALSPKLFNVIMDVMTEEVREEPPLCILYADDIVLVAETKQELQRKMEGWRTALESRGAEDKHEKDGVFHNGHRRRSTVNDTNRWIEPEESGPL
ncbi:uncharacterized protein LOC119569769 [Penaeus monodon]|uniref:uncharacterized protein LOC119569769 n=1 Tax=Penaeus monodon TaxID=6687 RepID=UPI0018A771E4|nr:uncharacterized protein LOC119569769 [Penaeus monodon]